MARKSSQPVRHIWPARRASGDTAFWSAHVDRYEVHLWHVNGDLLRTIQGSVSWFVSEASEPTPPRLVGLWEDAGVLWSLVLVPDENWRAAVTRGPHPRGYTIDDYAGYRDSILQAVDVQTGAILGEHRLIASFRLAS